MPPLPLPTPTAELLCEIDRARLKIATVARRAFTDDLVERARMLMARQDPHGCVQLVRGMKGRIASDDLLADITIPASILVGAQDSYIEPASPRETAQQITDGVVRVPRGCRQFEAPQATADALAAWARRVSA